MFVWYLVFDVALVGAVYLLRRTPLVNLALLLCSLAIGITGIEAYYRFIYAQSSGVGLRGGQNFAERYYRFDEWGLRASNLPLSKSRPNLVVLGDSHVFGAGLKDPSERFSAILAERLRNLHVVNLGFSGWDTTHELEQLDKHLDSPGLEVPLVILAYFFNDIEGDVTPQDRQRIAPAEAAPKPTSMDRFLQWLSRGSRFVELFYYRLGYPRLVSDRLGQIQTFYDDPSIRARHLDTIVRLRNLVPERAGGRLLVVLLPYLHSPELLNKTTLYDGFAAALKQRGIETINMQPTFASEGVEKLWVNPHDPHTNGFANQLIAREILRYLEEHPEMLPAGSVR